MDLSFTPEYEAFRAEVRSFLAANWPGRQRGGPKPSTQEVIAFRKLATEAGYLYRNIPREYGGSEQPSDVLKAHIINEEFGKSRAPMGEQGVGMQLLAPTLLELGTPEQKALFVPKTLSGEYQWAQGYSEPGAGSDLASVRTRAELVNGKWVINGQKVWSTKADRAHYMFALVRTEPNAKKHAGLSYILLDLRQPGVSIRPLKQITGGADFNEVFFTDAVAPLEWTIGQRGEGWTVSRTTLRHERSYIGNIGRSEVLVDRLLDMLRKTQLDGAPAITRTDVRQGMVALTAHLEALRYSAYRQMSMAARAEDPGIIGLVTKLYATHIASETARIARQATGDSFMLAPPLDGDRADAGLERWNMQFLGSLGVAIAGGTSNIQRNIISERGLGLRFRDTP
jgi:alkylation response protein AidB-like acyl-CoA dehydrogenase